MGRTLRDGKEGTIRKFEVEFAIEESLRKGLRVSSDSVWTIKRGREGIFYIIPRIEQVELS